MMKVNTIWERELFELRLVAPTFLLESPCSKLSIQAYEMHNDKNNERHSTRIAENVNQQVHLV